MANSLHSRILSDPEGLANALNGHSDYRVLRRLPETDAIPARPCSPMAIRVAVVDCETTGLNPDADRMIELAITGLLINQQGDATVIHPTRSWLQDPGFALTPEISRLTGISDELLAGLVFDRDAIEYALGRADLIVAHNAHFDRGFVAREFPIAARRPWACSYRDIDWGVHGYDGRALGYLLMQAGWFHDGHRAGMDSWALTMLLARPGNDGRCLADHLIDHAMQDWSRIFAVGAHFETKDALKAVGYRWMPGRKLWFKDVAACDIDAEIRALHRLHPGLRPVSEPLDPLQRYA